MSSRLQAEPRGNHPRVKKMLPLDAIDASIARTQATWVGLASSGFILLPAGRDIVAEGTAILPGDEELISALTMANPDAKRWFWGMSGPVHTSNCRGASLITAALSHRWGLNHCFLSILKLQAINQKDLAAHESNCRAPDSLVDLRTGQGDAPPTAATFLYCVLGQSDMGGAADLGEASSRSAACVTPPAATSRANQGTQTTTACARTINRRLRRDTMTSKESAA